MENVDGQAAGHQPDRTVDCRRHQAPEQSSGETRGLFPVHSLPPEFRIKSLRDFM
jgi:hypothetical protein